MCARSALFGGFGGLEKGQVFVVVNPEFGTV